MDAPPEWSLTEDLKPSAHRAYKHWEDAPPGGAQQVWDVEVYSEAIAGRKVLHMGTVTIRGSWAGNGPITLAIS